MTAHPLQPMPRPIARAVRLLAAMAVAAASIAHAAQTQIADEPLITQAEFKPKPNLMVILDDSGSMGSDYMPDVANYATSRFGLYTPQCNGVAYDPSYSYTPPRKSDGTSYDPAVFTAALADGFDSTSTSVDLTGNSRTLTVTMDTAVGSSATTFTFRSNNTAALGADSFPPGVKVKLTGGGSRVIEGTVDTWTYDAGTDKGTLKLKNITTASGTGTATAWTATFAGQFYFTYRGSEPKLGYTYDTSGTVQDNTFRNQCNLSRTSAWGTANGNVFEFNVITAESPEAIKTNYANWYSYYRTRQLLMRTAMGQALGPLGEDYRIGFMTINKRSKASGTGDAEFRPVIDFNAAHKADFYSSLYTSAASGSTPLRGALSTAGRYFAKNLSSQKTDPMQYACQRNFSLLTTDGYWNETFNGNGGLGAATIGNADGGAGAPYQDSHSNTLADVAYYYYATDLRNGTPGSAACTGAPVNGNPGQDVCANIVAPSGKDTATHQHMTTFTIGLGVIGNKAFTTDEAAIKNITWDEPVNNTITTVDDLWHASINGRGQHYSAQDAQQLSTAIQGIVTAIQDVTGAGSATATSTLDLVQGDGNIAFEASYTTGSWFGDVQARELDSHTAAVKAGDPKWSARAKLDAKSAASRKIYFKNGTALSEFTWDNLTTALKANFQDLCASPARLTQCATLSTGNKTTVNGGAELVAYLRGDRTKEATATNATAPLFRERKSVLGDIINSKPVHVGKPPFGYTDAGYAAFKTSQVNRKKVVYVGANDGMLHALDAATGEELWAYVPTAVMPNLYKLADVKYGSNTSQPHTYFVDGKTVQGDVYINGAWKTILVGGLNKGGRAYYALDVTDPDAPEALWEFTDDNLGLTYSDPVISKLADGTWTVAFGSGYNNVSPGDGKGRLFVVNAATGAVLRDIPTTAGSTATPSGMAKINVWVKSLSDNTAQRFYAGDLLGNLWRFDVDDLVAPKKGALLLARMQDASGNAQPITTEPKLREYDKQPIVAVATGRYLGRDDIDDTQVQSIAAIRDPLTATGWGVVRTSSAFKKVTIAKTGTTASGAAVTVDWATGGGWWADLPTGGERVAMPMEWDGARLLAATTLPDGNQCKSGGASWLYSFGLAGGATKGEQYSPDTLIVGFSVVTTDDGKPKIIVRTSGNKTDVKDGTGLGGGTTIKRARRVSWRELN